MFRKIIVCATFEASQIGKQFLNFGDPPLACHCIQIFDNKYKLFFFNDEQKYNRYLEMLKNIGGYTSEKFYVLYFKTDMMTFVDWVKFKQFLNFIGILDSLSAKLDTSLFQGYFES